MAEEVKEAPKEEETKEPSEKVENSEETQSQEKNPETEKVAEEAKEEPVKVESPVGEEKPEPKSVVEEVVETEEEEVVEDKSSGLTSKISAVELEIARAVHPEIDPKSSKFDSKLEEDSLKEYIYQWARLPEGSKGPTFREAVVQVLSERSEKSEPGKDMGKKEEATATAKTIPGAQAEETINSEKHAELVEAVKRGNQGAIVELLRARKKTEES
jgi:hypothetical protein